MHHNKLITLSLITITALSVSACGKKEVVSVDVPNTSETVVETVKPAEPIVVSVEPINEAKEDTAEVEVTLADPDLDYYGKDEEKQSYKTTGLPTVKEEETTTATATPSNEPLDEDGFTAQANEFFGETWHVEYFEGGTW